MSITSVPRRLSLAFVMFLPPLESQAATAEYYKNRVIYILPYVKHILPLKYRDEFICKATICDARFKIILDYEIRLAADGKICARGRTEQAAVKAPEMEIMFKIPDEISRALGF